MKEKLYWIMLAGIFGPASAELWKLIKLSGSPDEGYRFLNEGKFTLTLSQKKSFNYWTKEKASQVMKECTEKNIAVITFDDESYPSKLKTIYDPPAVLYAKGNLNCLEEEMTIAVVGTRNPSEYGAKAAYRISAELAKVGFTTVSGFAAGIDTACHSGTISAGGSTVAVLGCGVDVVYPPSNMKLYDVLMSRGVFVSEFPPGTPPLGRHFPLRNRIISGLSLGVFVAEAPLHSGALITADQAIEQGRDVFCLPPCSIFENRFLGVVKYIRDGAVPVFSHLDIIYEYCTNFSHKLSPANPSEEFASARTESSVFAVTGKKEKTNAGTPSVRKKEKNTDGDVTEKAGRKPDLSEFDGTQRIIAGFLAEREHHIDELCERTGLDMPDLLTELTEMEMNRTVRSLPGNIYSLNS